MKILGLLIFSAFTTSAWAIDHCNGIYDGKYFHSTGFLTIDLRETPRLYEVDVRVVYKGRVFDGRGYCDDRSVRFAFYSGRELIQHYAQFENSKNPSFSGAMFSNGVFQDDFNVRRRN